MSGIRQRWNVRSRSIPCARTCRCRERHLRPVSWTLTPSAFFRQASCDSPLVSAPGGVPPARAGPTLLRQGGPPRDRDCHAAPLSPGPPSVAPVRRPCRACGTMATAPSLSQSSVLRPAGHPAALNRDCRQALDPSTQTSGEAIRPVGNDRACPPIGEGEPFLGLPAHPRRTRRHGHYHRRLERLDDPETPRHRALTAAIMAELGRVPRGPNEGHGRLRLLQRRHPPAPPALCALLHPLRQPTRPDRGHDRQSGRRLGNRTARNIFIEFADRRGRSSSSSVTETPRSPRPSMPSAPRIESGSSRLRSECRGERHRPTGGGHHPARVPRQHADHQTASP